MYIHKSHSTGWGHNQHHTSHNLNDPLLTLINRILNIHIYFGTGEALRLLNSLKHLKLSAFCIRHLDCSSMWIDNKWALVHVMIRRPLVNSHYLRQWWPSSLTHMCVIRHQPTKMAICIVTANTHHILEIIYHVLRKLIYSLWTQTHLFQVCWQIANGTGISPSRQLWDGTNNTGTTSCKLYEYNKLQSSCYVLSHKFISDTEATLKDVDKWSA